MALTKVIGAGLSNVDGPVGIGIDPDTISNGKAVQVNRTVINDDDGGSLHIAQNGYYNSAWKYVENGTAEKITTASGVISFSNASSNSSGADASLSWSERMRIDADGNVGIGGSPSKPFHVQTDSGWGTMRLQGASDSGGELEFYQGASTKNGSIFYDTSNNLNVRCGASTEVMKIIASNGKVGIGDSSPAYRIELPNNGDSTGQGRANSWVAYSDGRLKKDITEVDYGLETVKKLKPSKYFHKNSTKNDKGAFVILDEGFKDIGLVAQDVLPLIPEIVGVPDDVDNELYSLDYSKLTTVLIKAIQELSTKNDTLEARIKKLEDG